jgi:tetratricopeptide (TPR) repeat protein
MTPLARTLIHACILTLLIFRATALVAAEDTAAAMEDPVLERANAATARKDWDAARAILREALAGNPQNAEYHNLYAYAIRMGAKPDLSLVFKHYNEALRIDPKHRGAHEYIGEAYLMVGNLEKAKEHLGVLNRLCFFPCREHSDLRRAIADYENKKPTR